jgi:hypothetical protein
MQLSLCLPTRENYALKCSIADNQTPVFKFVYQKKNTKIGDQCGPCTAEDEIYQKGDPCAQPTTKRKLRERERENCS